MPPLNPNQDARPARTQWRSLDDLANSVEFREWMHREFPSGASEMLDGNDRRQFLRIMGASFALAGMGMAGCRRWPEEEIVPATVGTPERIAGVPVEYATVVEHGGVGHAVLAKSYEGRPVKLEGNPLQSTTLGASTGQTQASILDLYDPDRSTGIREGGEERGADGWAAFRTWAADRALALGDGSGLRVLCESTSSPSVAMMRRRLATVFPRMTWHEFESVSGDEGVEGGRRAFGGEWRRELSLEAADVIVSFGADLFGDEPDAITNGRGWADRRKYTSPEDAPNRLYVFEAALTMTGASADERVSMRANDVAVAASYVAGRIVGAESGRLAETQAAVLTDDMKKALDHVIEDLEAHRGRCVLVPGRSQPAAVHYLCHLLNNRLGNVGETITYRRLGASPADHGRSIADLAAAIDAGSVDTLLVLGGNPAYDAPGDLDFATKLDAVANVVHCGLYADETAEKAAWHINRAHFLESWGDARGFDGTMSIQQPLVEPLFGGRTIAEVLAVFAGVNLDAMGVARAAFIEASGSREESAWRTALHDGVYGEPYRDGRPTIDTNALPEVMSTLETRWNAQSGGAFELVFAPSPSIGDGRYANNGWLQECPDPLTKLTWDNAAIMSPKAARDLGVGDGDHVTISVGDASIEIPVIRLPGVNDDTVVLELGYGRRMDGRICAGAGFDVNPLRSVDAMDIRGGATVAKASGKTILATTQDHHTIDADSFAGSKLPDRLPSIVRGADWNEFEKDPKFAAHRTHVPSRLSMWEAPKLDGMYKWGMTIDLNACTGCNACVVACQAENNIPIVGKEQVTRGREMHWLRIDRYFEFEAKADGKPDGDRMTAVMMQPMMCVHCENAPCEQVCPVAATVHDHDGLNVMVYNRCIGTRYCSNNCPYKVRRFNYLDYHRRDPMRDRTVLEVQPDYYKREQSGANELKQMQFNPEVTVRMRGVMEKCTYCTQRIADARIDAKNEWARRRSKAAREQLEAEGLDAVSRQEFTEERVPVADGRIKTACEQACPTGAIVFGDLRDEEARVSKGHKNPRAYELLEELHVKPRTKYLATVRNPFGGGDAGHDSHGHGDGHKDHSGDHSESSDNAGH